MQNFKFIFCWTLVLCFVASSIAYNCQLCYGDMCCNIPSDHQYYLTDFCGGYPHDQTSCGNFCDQFRYFTADRQRFGCGGYLNICGRGKCVKAKVIDAGPANWVEQDAGMPIIDASPDVCSYITGAGSCGWSDRILISAVPTTVKDDSELGPWNVTEKEYNQIVSEGQLLYDQWIKSHAPQATCCSPDQWEAYSFSFDPRHHFRAGLNISYDYTGKRFRILIEEHRNGNRSRVLESIALYDKKTLYVIDHTNNGACRKEPLTGDMEQDCVPSDGKKEASITIGGSLKADVWVFNRTEHEHDLHFVQVRTTAECYPIDSFASSERIGVDTTFTWDITKGIKNPAVFTPPSNCPADKTIAHHFYPSLLKITRSIALGKLWDLKLKM